MISVVTGAAVERLLVHATTSVSNYSQITLCSPFIDQSVVARLRNLCDAAVNSRCTIIIITTPGGEEQLAGLEYNPRQRVRIVVRERLHTKAYLLRARKRFRNSEAVITSANLTQAGFRTNEELGVHIRCTSAGSRRLLEQIERSLRRLSVQ